ncbi:MAG: hypothetical protein LC792_27175 [Actinobacteria bacterium]|nr:hypothetical protein [Actinomycetota bacterium]
MPSRRLYLGLHLLDRQLVDRKRQLAGKVDDLELEQSDTGELSVTAILAGPGVLARRLGRTTFGHWRERALAILSEGRPPRTRIPLSQVAEIGNHVDLAVDREDLATFASERWVQDHLIGHIPGARHAPE